MLQGKERLEIVKKILPCKKYGCIFRLVETGDAFFIYKLRTDPVLSRFVNPVESNVIDQVKWINDYKKREANGVEFYIISIDPQTCSRQGVNRLYDFRHNSFELGSWLYIPDEDISKSILGDIFTREIGYDTFGYDFCTFNVRKENKSVIRYHRSYSPELIDEDDLNLYFKLSAEAFYKHKQKILNICGYGQLT